MTPFHECTTEFKLGFFFWRPLKKTNTPHGEDSLSATVVCVTTFCTISQRSQGIEKEPYFLTQEKHSWYEFCGWRKAGVVQYPACPTLSCDYHCASCTNKYKLISQSHSPHQHHLKQEGQFGWQAPPPPVQQQVTITMSLRLHWTQRLVGHAPKGGRAFF